MSHFCPISGQYKATWGNQNEKLLHIGLFGLRIRIRINNHFIVCVHRMGLCFSETNVIFYGRSNQLFILNIWCIKKVCKVLQM
uniref:Uncharacterized protein n=1 Tax=Pyxicephalus adspersus TaxID=30357 RepID=A0AAV3B373_PYXAD|nr:TPA: hypothetical protein GDO54_002134 [Pyxicephalus adspersus]